MKKESEDFIQAIQQTLNEANRNLDGNIRSRLNQARHTALESRKVTQPKRNIGWGLVPAAGLVLLAVLLYRQHAPKFELQTSGLNDWQIITAEESLDFYQEDVAFYEWLSEIMEEESSHYDSSGDDSAVDDDLLTGNRARTGSAAESGTYPVSRFI